MASINTRLNIEKLDGNIVQKHGCSKQVRVKQLGTGVEIGVHEVHDKKRVWFEVELQGAQGDREVKVFQVSNNDTALAQRRLKDKQTKEKTNTDCLRSTQQCMKSRVAKHLGVAAIQQQNRFVDETNVTLFAKVRCFLIQSGLSKVFWAWDTTRSTYLVNRSQSSTIGFKKPIDMLGFFGWLANIKQGMLEPVKFKCIFLGYHKSIVGNKLWSLDDVTSKVVLYRNMSFNESGEYMKTFISSGVGSGSMQMWHRFEFEMKPLGDHTFEVEPQENVDQGACLQEVQTQYLMDYQLARDREHLACELFGYRENSNEDAFAVAALDKIYTHELLNFNNTVFYEEISKWNARLKDDMDARSDVYVLSNDCRKSSNDSHDCYWEDQSGNTLKVSQSRFYNEKLVQTLLEGHSMLSLEGSLSGDCDVEKNGNWSYIYTDGSQEYQMVCTRVDIAYADVGSLKANLQHIEALSTTEAGYMTFTEAWKKEIWLKGLLTESRYELRLVTGIATGALVKVVLGPRFQHRPKLLCIGIN
nr:zinc finger, CCHC-type [Tanacetum cinerariifolium]